MSIDFRRCAIINQLKMRTQTVSDDRLLNFLQLEMVPTCVSDCAVKLEDVDTENLRKAMRIIVGH